MLSYNHRFHGHSSLRYVFKNGEAARSRELTLRWSANKHRRTSRFSVSISKKVLKSAVKRNRVRRRLYEIIRLALPDLNGTYDIVFIVTSPELLTLDHAMFKEAVLKPMREAGLLRTSVL